mmetsp:Transcript_5518/g.20852  ORF Transcript_5518/g.20852 Transcript_5518/m.20852 type:complete len:215 (-) Transcript_5518:2749-3393(-)
MNPIARRNKRWGTASSCFSKGAASGSRVPIDSCEGEKIPSAALVAVHAAATACTTSASYSAICSTVRYFKLNALSLSLLLSNRSCVKSVSTAPSMWHNILITLPEVMLGRFRSKPASFVRRSNRAGDGYDHSATKPRACAAAARARPARRGGLKPSSYPLPIASQYIPETQSARIILSNHSSSVNASLDRQSHRTIASVAPVAASANRSERTHG